MEAAPVLNLFSRLSGQSTSSCCLAFHLALLCNGCNEDSQELPQLPTEEVLLLGDRLTSLEDAAELSVRTPDEIILARYLDDLGLPYVFDVSLVGAINREPLC